MGMMWKWAAGLAAILVVGCGAKETREPVFPVRGQVIQGGQPVAGATVVFHRHDDNGSRLRPTGFTNSKGRFRLTTYDTNDGCPAGEYIVTVIVHGPEPEAAEAEAGTPVVSVGPARYADPSTSTLRARIEPTVNDLAPFVLQGE